MQQLSNHFTPVLLQNAQKSNKTAGNRLQLVSVKKADVPSDYTKYGTFEQIFSEDFSLLTTGSIGNPDMQSNLYDKYTVIDDHDGSEAEISWYSFNPIYTHSYENTSGRWGESECYSWVGLFTYICMTTTTM